MLTVRARVRGSAGGGDAGELESLLERASVDDGGHEEGELESPSAFPSPLPGGRASLRCDLWPNLRSVAAWLVEECMAVGSGSGPDSVGCLTVRSDPEGTTPVRPAQLVLPVPYYSPALSYMHFANRQVHGMVSQLLRSQVASEAAPFLELSGAAAIELREERDDLKLELSDAKALLAKAQADVTQLIEEQVTAPVLMCTVTLACTAPALR